MRVKEIKLTKRGDILEQKRWIQSTPNLVLLQKLLSFKIRRMSVFPFIFFPFISDGVRSLHYPA